YLDGARSIATGHNPYHRLLLQSIDPRNGTSTLPSTGYIYPPLLASVLAVPLRMGVSDAAIAVLWSLLNAALLLWMGWELNLGLRGQRDWLGAVAWANLCLLPAIVTYDLHLGQADVVLAALATGAFGAWARGNRWGAVVLALAVAIKITLVPLLLLWLWKRDWRATLTACAATGVLVFLPFCLTGWQSLVDWLTFITRSNALGGSADFVNQAPLGMLLRLFSPNGFIAPVLALPWLVLPLRLASAALAVGVWLWAVPRAPASSRARALTECLLALPVIVLISPLAEDIHFCLIVPTLAALSYLAWRHRAAVGGLRWAIWAASALFCLPHLQDLIYPNRLFALPGQSLPLLGGLIVILRMGLFLWIAWVGVLAGSLSLHRMAAPPSEPAGIDVPNATAIRV
nr:DUF2029 domain-containing protein [Ktedonobacterales bacterium]